MSKVHEWKRGLVHRVQVCLPRIVVRANMFIRFRYSPDRLIDDRQKNQ
jgi:hypothetical protein